MKLYFSCSWATEYPRLKFFLDDKGKWNDLELTNRREEADYFVVLNYPNAIDEGKLDFKRTIVFQMEPETTRCRWKDGWANPRYESFFFVHDTTNYRNITEWHLNKSYTYLMNHSPDKTRLCSAVISNLNYLPGHKLRQQFFHLAKRIIPIDGYGQGCQEARLENKEDALLPYRYHFNAENTQERNYWTEKIGDGILAECLTFYWGCPNLIQWINPRAWIYIDISKPQEAIKTMQVAISNHEWEKRIDDIRQEKKKILTHLQIFPTIDRIIKDKNK